MIQGSSGKVGRLVLSSLETKKWRQSGPRNGLARFNEMQDAVFSSPFTAIVYV